MGHHELKAEPLTVSPPEVKIVTAQVIAEQRDRALAEIAVLLERMDKALEIVAEKAPELYAEISVALARGRE